MLTVSRRAAAACAALALPCALSSQQRSFSVRDDIAMTRISQPRAEPHEPGSEIAWPSPDGGYVAIVVSRGLLDQDLIESRVLVFELRSIRRALAEPLIAMPEPHVVATVRSTPAAIETDAYAPVIKDLRWSEDGLTIYFRATNLHGNYQLCSVKRNGTGLRRLTPEDRSVDRFDVLGDTAVYDASDPTPRLIAAGVPINRDAANVTDARLQDVLFPDDVTAHVDGLFRLYTLTLNATSSVPWEVPRYSLEEIPYLTALYPFRTSPDRKFVVKLEPPASVPESWSAFAPTEGLEHLRLTEGRDPRLLRSDNVLRPLVYTMIDLKTGDRTPLLDAPNARSLGYGFDASRVAWSPDGTRVLVTNTFLPLSSSIGDAYPCSVASVDLPSRNVRCLLMQSHALDPNAPHVQDVAFAEKSSEALVLFKDGPGRQELRRYQLRADGWAIESSTALDRPVQTVADLSSDRRPDASRITISVKQTLNDPPMVWAGDSSGRKREVWDPNPQFHNLRFGKAEPYEWTDAAGRNWSGILVKPVGYVAGKRYPLVLQMYNFVDEEFITDGLYPTAFAARELASEGFVVLQIRKKRDTLTEDDPRIHLEGYRSAIQSISDTGLIDRQKVGVVGFSWTCWYAAYALIEDPMLFAAATIADGLDNSYLQYKLFTPGDYILEQQMAKIRGGAPFGKSLEHWVETAPGFRADGIEAPVRLEAIGHSSVLQEWELYSSLRLLKKPVDLIYFPNGSHIHELPMERLESQQGNVDWMRFWLKGEEDSDPAKRDQFKRWERLRDDRGGSAAHPESAQP